jgi:hypothetical protein
MNVRYIFGSLVGILLLVVVFLLIIRAFGGNEPKVEMFLPDYARTETVVRMTVEGQVNVDQDHRAAKVTIGRTSNTINLTQGYQGRVLQTKSYASNEAAYTTFLRALHLQGYTEGDNEPDKRDSRGFCPTGKVYTFDIITGDDAVQSLWTTSCGGGTFKGNTEVIRQLFRAQIPDYFKVLRGTRLN